MMFVVGRLAMRLWVVNWCPLGQGVEVEGGPSGRSAYRFATLSEAVQAMLKANDEVTWGESHYEVFEVTPGGLKRA